MSRWSGPFTATVGFHLLHWRTQHSALSTQHSALFMLRQDSYLGSLARSALPGPGELVFVIVLMITIVGGWHSLFNDPGTLWHLRLGRDILATGAVPYADTLTFTRTGSPLGQPVVGFRVLLALLVDMPAGRPPWH